MILKKHFLIAGLCTAVMALTPIQAQNKYTPAVAKQLQTEQASLRVMIVFADKVDLKKLHADFERDAIPVKQRPALVSRALKEQAAKSQNEIVKLYANHTGFKAYQSFWIANVMYAELSHALVYELSAREGIAYIELAEEKKISGTPPVYTEKAAAAPNGVEPGLVAIGAPDLWAMGYTGRGRIAMSIDTGFWWAHPAISDHFVGNYKSLSQSWKSFDALEPADKESSHGTHTIGTMMGLEAENNDTLGVAYNAYFIASDPVVSDLADLKLLSEFMPAFEWAMNPDGDEETTDDIPDVINNSWGFDPSWEEVDMDQCDSYISDVMDAVEAAGIANVFSAGNNGPEASSIGAPQNYSGTLQNCFTVGSIQAEEEGYPISSFSSRGPSLCPVSDELIIKPEVVAPGQQVRSAVGTDEYALYNGTSMAAPHVAGAVLLLKEAFPEVEGPELLAALYHSASDLGDEGEDNTYGNGMINLLDAFNYLVGEGHIPSDPTTYEYDLAVSPIENLPEKYTCDDSFTTTINITNKGTQSVSSATITYGFEGESTETYEWTGTLEADASVSIELDPIDTDSGWKQFNVMLSHPNSNDEIDLINNQRTKRFQIKPTKTLPYWEGFEAGLSQEEWYINNPDYINTWGLLESNGLPFSEQSAIAQLNSYGPRMQQEDELHSASFDLSGTAPFNLNFYTAYKAKTSTIFHDTLKVWVSTNCGATFDDMIYVKGGNDLSSIADGAAPETMDDWQQETVSLDEYAGQHILIKFQSINNRGNNLYLDNVSVYQGTEAPLSIGETEIRKFSLYPNPTLSVCYLETTATTDAQLQLHDLYGRLINTSMRYDGLRYTIDTERLPVGIYFLQYTDKDIRKQFKIVKR